MIQLDTQTPKWLNPNAIKETSQRTKMIAGAAFATTLVLYFLLFSSSSHSRPVFEIPPASISDKGIHFPTVSTAQKIQRAEQLHEASVAQRKQLIQRLGPKPEQISPFPTDREDFDHRMAMLWDFFPESFPCPHETERVGVIADGGKYVCGADRLVQMPGCTIYSFGVERQSSFEAALLSRSKNCKVWAYDFSVSSIGPEIANDSALNARVKFRPYRFDNHNKAKTENNPETHTLDYMMNENGHTFIDLLKIDVEGSEFSVLNQMMNHANGKPLPFAQLNLEIHAWKTNEDQGFPFYLDFFNRLEDNGLRAFHSELNYPNSMTVSRPDVIEYSFINVRAPSYIVNDDL